MFFFLYALGIFSLFYATHALISTPFVIAHRGYSSAAPENTIPAFQLAAEAGCEGIEVDLLYTKDMQLVAFHDLTLNRTTNCTGFLSNYTYEELSNCDASYVNGTKFENFRGTKIPLFSDIVALAHNYSMFIVIDYKSPVPIGASVSRVINATFNDISVIGSCWYPWQLADFGANFSGAPRQYLSSNVNTSDISFWNTALSSGANGVSIKYTNITRDFVTQAHMRSLSVTAWTINNEPDMLTAIGNGVDGIITDYPTLLKQAIANFNSNSTPSDNAKYIKIWPYVLWPVVAGTGLLQALTLGIAIFYYRRTKYFKLNNFEW